MRGTGFCIIFILGTLVFIGGVFPISYFGIYAVAGLFGLWGLYTSLPRHLWVGIIAGIILDSFGVFPPGTHILVFFMLSTAMWAGKKILISRYLWGDLVLVVISMILGNIAIPLSAWVLGYDALSLRLSSGYLLHNVLALILAAVIFFLILRWQYRRGSIEAQNYAN